jgi:hypothetical protein
VAPEVTVAASVEMIVKNQKMMKIQMFQEQRMDI